MTFGARTAVIEVCHGDVVATNFHLETEFRMADAALIDRTVEPVRKNDGPHAPRLRAAVQYDVAVFGVRNDPKYQCQSGGGQQDPFHQFAAPMLRSTL